MNRPGDTPEDRVDIEEGTEVVRRTIVGGRPLQRRQHTLNVPIGIEKILVRAAGDDAFRARLFADRASALEQAGIALLPSEQAMLASVPDDLLASLVDRIDLPRHGGRRFMGRVVRAVFATAAAGAVVMLSDGCTGIEPDQDVGDNISELPVTLEDTATSRGAVPEDIVVQETRDDDLAAADGSEP